jgi:hypothetical protein
MRKRVSPTYVKLRRRIARESEAAIWEQRQNRPVIVSLEPPDLIGFRLKGTRRTYHLTAGRCYRLAVQASIEYDRKQKKARKAA